MSEPDNDFDEQEIRRAFSGGWHFAEAAGSLDRIPPSRGLEVAFVGRSNVGKSSLINALTGQSSLARTSHTPGRTQELIFFRHLKVPDLCLVDLPGFGYAKVGKKLKRDWGKLITDYLLGRPNLGRVFFLIDGRRGIGEIDLGVMDLLDKSAVSYQVLITKLDKLKQAEHDEVVWQSERRLAKRPAAHPDIIVTSSVSGAGMKDLKQLLLVMAKQAGGA